MNARMIEINHFGQSISFLLDTEDTRSDEEIVSTTRREISIIVSHAGDKADLSNPQRVERPDTYPTED